MSRRIDQAKTNYLLSVLSNPDATTREKSVAYERLLALEGPRPAVTNPAPREPRSEAAPAGQKGSLAALAEELDREEAASRNPAPAAARRASSDPAAERRTRIEQEMRGEC